jgi:hypothetical protein
LCVMPSVCICYVVECLDVMLYDKGDTPK